MNIDNYPQALRQHWTAPFMRIPRPYVLPIQHPQPRVIDIADIIKSYLENRTEIKQLVDNVTSEIETSTRKHVEKIVNDHALNKQYFAAVERTATAVVRKQNTKIRSFQIQIGVLSLVMCTGFMYLFWSR
jgi:tRNA U54 and U55 pseudouridine synthase Pus10